MSLSSTPASLDDLPRPREATVARRRPRPPGWIGAAAAVGLLLRLAFGLGYWQSQPLTRDEQEYLTLAASLVGGRGFTYDLPAAPAAGDEFGRAPGYPAFVAAVMWYDGDFGAGRLPSAVPTALKAVQALVGSLGIVLIAGLTARAAGARAAAVAAWIAACHPALIWIPAYALSECLFSTLALGCTLALRALDQKPGLPVDLPRSAGAGLLAGLAILTRPAMLPFVGLAAGWLVLRGQRRDAAALALGTILVLAPWTVRNLEAHGRFVLVAAEGGITFWTGNHPEAIGEGDLAANPHLKVLDLAFRQRHPGLPAEELEPFYYAEALRYIREQPLDWLTLEARKLFYLVVPIGPSYRLHSARYYWGSVVPYVALLPLAVLGFGDLARRRHPPRALLAQVLSAVVVCLVFFPQERFRIPIIDPALVVGAAAYLAARRSSSPEA